MAAYIAIPKLGMSMTEASEELEALQKEPAREILTTVAGEPRASSALIAVKSLLNKDGGKDR